MSKQHTPTPWADNGNEIVDAKGNVIAAAITDEDGEFIVKAVNSHDQLVAALRKAWEDINWMTNSVQLLNRDVFRYLDDVLEKVGEA